MEQKEMKLRTASQLQPAWLPSYRWWMPVIIAMTIAAGLFLYATRSIAVAVNTGDAAVALRVRPGQIVRIAAS